MGAITVPGSGAVSTRAVGDIGGSVGGSEGAKSL